MLKNGLQGRQLLYLPKNHIHKKKEIRKSKNKTKIYLTYIPK